jgi:hypothetical protein
MKKVPQSNTLIQRQPESPNHNRRSNLLDISETGYSESSLPFQNAPKISQISFNELTIEKEIGEGSYGKVCVGKWNQAAVALKFCRRKGNMNEFMNEMKLMMYESILCFILK